MEKRADSASLRATFPGNQPNTEKDAQASGREARGRTPHLEWNTLGNSSKNGGQRNARPAKFAANSIGFANRKGGAIFSKCDARSRFAAADFYVLFFSKPLKADQWPAHIGESPPYQVYTRNNENSQNKHKKNNNFSTDFALLCPQKKTPLGKYAENSALNYPRPANPTAKNIHLVCARGKGKKKI